MQIQSQKGKTFELKTKYVLLNLQPNTFSYRFKKPKFPGLLFISSGPKNLDKSNSI